MKVVRFTTRDNPTPRVGALHDQQVTPFEASVGPLDAATGAASPPAGPTLALQDIQLLAPIGTPPSIRDFMSFEEHVITSMAALGQQVDRVWYEQPVFYFSNPAAVIGPGDCVPMAPGSVAFDFEVEIAAVIGHPATNVDAADAEPHIAGYTLLCDWSARDLQERELKVGLGPAKAKDTATTIGPWLVTPDELAHLKTDTGYDIELTATVNGRPYSKGTWANIHWSFAQMISYASRGTTLRTGDVIGSGTIGTGCILELGRVHGFDAYPYLTEGDTVTIDGGPLGSLTQTVTAGPAPTRL